jgi:hypothetical protein
VRILRYAAIIHVSEVNIFPCLAVASGRPEIVDELVSDLSEQSPRLFVVLEVVAKAPGHLAPVWIFRGHAKRDGAAADIQRLIVAFVVAFGVAANEVVEPLGEQAASQLQLLGVLLG